MGWQLPISTPAEVHASDAGQPFPPVIRQPGTQREVAASQTRPDVAPPQSASMAQPQDPPITQRAPARSARQADWSAGVHSTHIFEAVAQTNGAAQSALTRHWTQRSAVSVLSQRRNGSPQSASVTHPVTGSQRPTPATTSTHVWPPGQPLRPGPQPGVQNPLGPVQMTPDIASPHPASVEQPHRPVARRHCGCAPPQSEALVAEHSVQAPASGPVFWQAGRAGSGQLGPPSEVHGTQACVADEQTGVVPPQSALPRQLTHTPPPPDVSQRGEAGPQRLLSPAVQTTHAPVPRHTGACAPQSAPDVQPRHVCVPASQIGLTPEQSDEVTHSTQVIVAPSQTLFMAAQTPGLPAAHG
jgi:hypothetical protein